jgi:hypothetical protein
MHHARTGERLFGNSPWTCTRCQEEIDGTYGEYPVVVGGFESLGLLVSHNLFHRCNSNGIAGCRKFFRALGPLVFGT